MNADDIIKIINAIPDYIIYIYPGYITIYTYYFFRGKTLQENKQILPKSILISYIYISITDFIPVKNIFWATIGYVVLSLLVAYGCYLFTKSDWALKIFKFLKIETTYYENEIEALAGIKNSAWLIVYLKNDNIAVEGSLGYKELEKGYERYITLESYSKYIVRADGTLDLDNPLCCYEGNYKEKCVIKYDEIKYIEKRDTSD